MSEEELRFAGQGRKEIELLLHVGVPLGAVNELRRLAVERELTLQQYVSLALIAIARESLDRRGGTKGRERKRTPFGIVLKPGSLAQGMDSATLIIEENQRTRFVSARKRLKLKQREVASVLGVSQGQVSSWELGRFAISPRALEQLEEMAERRKEGKT